MAALINKNPLRYRGYIYDTDTGFYYLQSRYYDPKIGRFLNADSYASTGQGFVGYNMYAYCGNNPVNCSDKSGHAREIEIGSFGGGGAGDVLFCWIALIAGSLGVGNSQLSQTSSISVPKAEEETKVTTIPKRHGISVTFPEDPDTFSPLGLVKVPRSGTKNGRIISWMDPLTNTEVFRWDENPNYPDGPHYHINNPIYRKAKVHFYPGAFVPEPYATTYFPFR